jgi:hypothetical protein
MMNEVVQNVATVTCHPTEWLLVLFNGLLVIFTWRLAKATSGLWDAAGKQGQDTAKSIGEATRAATAMEGMVEATRNNANLMQAILHKQMRAYVAVDIGRGTYQDGRLRFAAAPVVNNTGFTPARNVSFRVMADILDTKLPKTFQFPEFAELKINDATLAPRQQFIIHGIVSNRFEDSEVQAIMTGEQRRLYVWGIVTYEDVFGGSWETRFCHNFVFPTGKDGVQVLGFYHHTHNHAT